MYKTMDRYLGKLKNFSLWSWEWMHVCKYCGASYMELQDGKNFCHECGSHLSLAGQKMFCHPFYDNVFTFDEYLHNIGMRREEST